MIRLFRLSCQQRFRVGLHLGTTHNRASNARARAHTRTYGRTALSPVFLVVFVVVVARRRRSRRVVRLLAPFAPFARSHSTAYRTRNAGRKARTAQYTLYALRPSNPRPPLWSRDCSSFKVIDVLVRSRT